MQLATVRFFSQVINKTPPPDIKDYFHRYIPDKTAIYLIIALLSSFIVIYFGGYRTRLAVLIFNLLIAGFFFNAQFSTVQITNLLSFSLPTAGFTGVFLLTVGVPLLVIIFGNVYCGYLCPFGALQELISYIIPDKFKPLPAPQTVRRAVFTRYVLLFIFITAFFLSGKPSVLVADPLIKIFSGMLDTVLIFTALIALLGSLFYTRFWCLYLCPAGAFLCLLNRISLLKRLLPAKRFARCEFAILPANIDDCIMCDRCRYNQMAKAIPYGTEKLTTAGKSAKQPAAVLFVTAVWASAIFISAITINGFLKAVPKSYTQPPVAITSTAQPQEDADIQRIRKMIETKKLSDKEALFYEKVE